MSIIGQFSIDFKETFPTFPTREFVNSDTTYFNSIDTRTVAILGVGRRRELLVRVARGDRSEGSAQNYDPSLPPSGRFFEISSFPVDRAEFKVFRGQNASVELDPSEYLLDEDNGYVVLYHPLLKGESLVFDYISLSDVNVARGYTKEEAQELYAIYGMPSIVNTISAAAEIAFANGAPRLVVVQGDHTGTDPYWSQAYAALETQNPWMIVPMQNGYYANVVAMGLEHVQLLSETPNRKERFLLVGEIKGDTDNPNVFGRVEVEGYAGEDRMAFIAADYPVSVIAGETATADGGYLAAAVAGLWASYEYIPQPLTNKNLARISLLWPKPDLYSQQQLNQLIEDGITLLAQRNDVAYITQFTTVIDNGNPVDLEPSIWRIRDYTAMSIRQLLENRYVGKPLVLDRILPAIENTVVLHLQSLVDQKILTNFANVNVDVDSIEPRQVNVGFDAEPVFPLNKLRISINVTASL